MIFVLPEIFLLLIASFLLGLAVGWLLWRWRRTQKSQSAQITSAASASESSTTTTVLDLTDPAERLHETGSSLTGSNAAGGGREAVGDLASGAATGSPNGGFTLLSERSGSLSDELAMTQDLLLASQDDLSSVEADLALAQEDLNATRELLMRAEAELAEERISQNQGSISEEEE